MTDHNSMTIDNLIAYRDQWPKQQSEWYRAHIVLQKRLAVVDELCRLCGELDAEGLVMVPKEPTEEMREAGVDNNPTYFNEGTDRGFAWEVVDTVYWAMICAAPLPASPSNVEG